MSMRIGGTDGARWASHISCVHLRTDWQRLTSDVQAGAGRAVIAADRAALAETRRDMVTRSGSGRLDITV